LTIYTDVNKLVIISNKEVNRQMKVQTVTIAREDFNNPLHPNLYDDLCNQFGLNPVTTDCICLKVIEAKKT
tara:strand:+ start:624 stop:836 length:213 start_codon:yes stop_codon:yes gene_type:complete